MRCSAAGIAFPFLSLLQLQRPPSSPHQSGAKEGGLPPLILSQSIKAAMHSSKLFVAASDASLSEYSTQHVVSIHSSSLESPLCDGPAVSCTLLACWMHVGYEQVLPTGQTPAKCENFVTPSPARKSRSREELRSVLSSILL